MRIILIILSLCALLFIGWIIMTVSGGKFGNFGSVGSGNTIVQSQQIDGITIEQLKHQLKTEQDLAEIKAQLSQITGSAPKPTISVNNEESSQNSENEIIPVSAKFLGKILPTIELTKKENAGIFDLRIFDNTFYTTYVDEKFGMTVVASLIDYETFLKNFQAIDKEVYTINTETPFPFESFYVNPKNSDTMVRLVMKVEAQTLFVSLPKTKFNTFKELILK